MVHSKYLIFLFLCLKHFSKGERYEPRLDELIKRVTALQSTMNIVNSIYKNTEELLEENRTRTQSKDHVIHISVGSGGNISSPPLESILPAIKSVITWELHAPVGYFISLTFPYFNLAYGEVSSGHVYNKLEILTKLSEGELVQDAVLSESPRNVRSYGNTMVLKYEANQLFNGIGFIAEYRPECKAKLKADTKEKNLFSHPLYGYENYSPNMDCEWMIEPKYIDDSVTLTLKEFHVGSQNISDLVDTSYDQALQEGFQESYCQNDFVEIYTLKNPRVSYGHPPSLQGRVCGDSVPSNLMTITGSCILVKFHTDDVDEVAGFSATYIFQRAKGR